MTFTSPDLIYNYYELLLVDAFGAYNQHMLPFIVQNYAISTPFLIKTRRYNKLPLLSQINLMYVFFKDQTQRPIMQGFLPQLHPVNQLLYDYNFRKPFWLFWARVYRRDSGVLTNNVTKSAMRWTLVNTYNRFFLNETIPAGLPKLRAFMNVRYLQPVKVLHFAFHKKSYHVVMFYILNILTSFNIAINSSYKLHYSFIFLPYNFIILPFLNIFYFRMNHY